MTAPAHRDQGRFASRLDRGRARAWRGLVGAAVLATGLLTASWRIDAQSPARGQAGDDRRPLAPADALASFALEPGYRIDLIAAEPLVQSPVAIAFDERGRLYVAENRGYPDPLEGQPAAQAQGVIALLTDRDADGRYDTRTEFATGLTYPNGIMVWDGGVFVTVAPDLLYLKDTDGDGVADVRRVALTGFNATRTAQIRFSHPTLGPDGWIYFTSGLNGGRVIDPAHPDRPPVVFSTSDSRYHPVTGAFELVGGQGQYGLTFDDEGHRFICANRHPVWQVVLEPRHLQRNPHLAFSETVQEVSTVGAEAAVWPLTRDLTTASFHPTLMATPHAGTFTSASGVHVHRGDALPAGHGGSVFVAESAQNLVQRQVRTDLGATFRSRPARDGVEFLASRDSWFRPVHLSNGPDGALYVVDMYRKDIDHPAYVPEESRRLFDLTAGRERGRIYRIAAAQTRPRAITTDLATVSPDALVSRLGDGNGWVRDTAQRLLVERRARGAAPALRALTAAGQPFGRLHALWTLEALGVLDDDTLRAAMEDVAPGVRENAVALAESRVAQPSILEAILARVDDTAPRVRLRVALALGNSTDARAVTALAAIARRDGVDRWVRAAVFSGIGTRSAAFLDAWSSGSGGAAPSAATRAAVMQDLGRLFGAAATRDDALMFVHRVSDPASELSWQPAALAGLAQGLRARGLTTGGAGVSVLFDLADGEAPLAVEARRRLATQVDRAAALASLDAAPVEQRVPAIDLLGYAGPATGPTILALLAPTQPGPVQAAAVRAIGQVGSPELVAGLLDRARWQAYSPRLRDAVLTMLMSDDRFVGVLLDGVAAGVVGGPALGPARARRLTAHRDAATAARARALLGGQDAGTGLPAYQRLRAPVTARAGDAPAGRQVFESQCVACHTFRGTGGRVGPDLSGIRNQPADALLLHIVVPDYEITPGYESYTVQLRDGRTLIGRVESETGGSLTLRDGAGEAHAVLRADIASLAATPSSLMPGTFGEVLSPRALADLIAWLKQ